MRSISAGEIYKSYVYSIAWIYNPDGINRKVFLFARIDEKKRISEWHHRTRLARSFWLLFFIRNRGYLVCVEKTVYFVCVCFCSAGCPFGLSNGSDFSPWRQRQHQIISIAHTAARINQFMVNAKHTHTHTENK